MGSNILLLSVVTLYHAANIHAEIPECSTVGGSCESSCEDVFLMPLPSCAGGKVCCRKSVNLALEIFSPSLDASGHDRRNGRCMKGRRACRKAKGACVNKSFGCNTAVVEGLCKGERCQCCLKDNCKSRKGKNGCAKKGGECKLAAVGCSSTQTAESGCKGGNRCVCCMGPPPDPRPYCANCGVSTIDPTRIVGGQETEIGEYPWQVLIILDQPNGAATQSACGGSLIKSKWVLTAAHCFKGITYGGMIVSLGDHDSTSGAEVASETYLYSGEEYQDFVTLHPDFKDPGENDIAVIELKFDAPTNKKGIKPICLAAPEDVVTGEKAVVTGWGFTEYRGDTSDVLLEVELDLISNEECSAKYTNSPFGQDYTITDDMICTLTSDKDACQGDSGGPLIRQIPDGRWVQIGIVSFGYQCAFNNAPGVYTNVANYIDWIDEATGSNTCS